jgi:cytidylate kinase
MIVMTSFENYERFLEVRLKTWNDPVKSKKDKLGPVLSISRETGSGGIRIAQMLADQLGMVVYDKEIVEQIAKVTQVSEQLVMTLDEKYRSELENWITMTQNEHGISSDSYLAGLRKVLFSIAAHGNAILLGRGGNFLLPVAKRIGLRLVAPLDTRIKNIMVDMKLSEESARKHIARGDEEKRSFVKHSFKVNIEDPVHYHLTINTATVKPEMILEIVKAMIRAES